MPKNTESLNRSLFDLLHSKGFDPTMLDTTGKEIPTPEEAEVFQFNFIKDGEDYGKVTMSIDGLHKLVIYFSDEVANSEKEESHGEDESWYKILNQLKRFAQKYQLSFELRNVDHLKHDMAKREYMKKQERISEGYYPMGKKASYSDAVPSVKIILQHTRQIEEGEQRYRNIAKIFLENQDGERFLAPTTKPGVARVYGRLIAEGDKPHGERWNHVTSLVEEYQKMGAFVRATRNGQFNESAQRLVNEGINHYQGLRETLSRMTGHRGYNTYFESWTPSLMEDETEETNLNELFVQETLDPRIESVMPILNKLQKKVAEMKEVGELTEWADNIIDEGAAVDAYMAGKSPALAHFADQLDNDIEEDDLDEQRFPDNSNSTAKRDIVVTNLNDLIKDPRQAHEPKRHGPDNSRVKVATRVMPSDKAKQMNRFKTGEKEVSEQKWPDTSTSLAKRGKVVANVTDLIKDPRLAHEPSREGPDNPKLKMATKVMPTINKDKPKFGTKLKDPKNYLPVKAGVFGPYEVEEGGLGDIANKVGGAVKKGANAVLNKLGHDDDTELLRKIQKDAGIPVTAQHGKPNMGHSKDEEFLEGTGQQLSVQQLATISDEALDNAYHYGRSTPGNSFGWQANLKSAQYAKQMIDKGVTDIEAISDAIHKGWNVTAQAFVQKPEQFDDTAKLQAAGKLEAKLQQRAELMKKNYSQLPEDEKEKDRVVARALLQALKGQQDVAESEFAGDYATGETGQWRNKGPKAHKPATIGDLVGENVEEGKGPLGQGDLGLALKSLGGSWSSWHEENSHDPDIEVYEYDDGEGGYYASGSIEHNLKTGEIEIHYQDGENDVDIDGTFHSIGDAMKALRGGNSYPSWGGKKPNFDRLGQRKQHGPDDLRKTDRTGRKGTLAGGPTNQLKQNIQWSKGKHGPKGVLPEGQEDLDTIRRLLKK